MTSSRSQDDLPRPLSPVGPALGTSDQQLHRAPCFDGPPAGSVIGLCRLKVLNDISADNPTFSFLMVVKLCSQSCSLVCI